MGEGEKELKVYPNVSKLQRSVLEYWRKKRFHGEEILDSNFEESKGLM
jgi:hypothetical protein